MSKSGSRKSESKNAPGQSGRPPLSPDEADRAAAAFVPLWQFDEAPFAASPKLADADVRALASPGKATLIGMQLAPAPALSAAAPVAPAAVAPTEQDLLESRSTVKMTPLHLPNAERPADPDLPSVIVEPGTPVAALASEIITERDALRDKKTVPDPRQPSGRAAGCRSPRRSAVRKRFRRPRAPAPRRVPAPPPTPTNSPMATRSLGAAPR